MEEVMFFDVDLRDDSEDNYDDYNDDGDYFGVERDENMSRIEGDDFWMESEPIDSWCD